jgi:hypothetical protein
LEQEKCVQDIINNANSTELVAGACSVENRDLCANETPAPVTDLVQKLVRVDVTSEESVKIGVGRLG